MLDRYGSHARREASVNGWSVLLRADPTPEDVRAALVAVLFNRTALLAASCVACLGVAWCAWVRIGGFWCVAWVGLYLGVNLLRFAMIGRYHRHAAAKTLGSADRWAWRYTYAGMASQFMMGLGCLGCLVSGDTLLELFSMMVVVAVAGALSSRNAGLPRLAAAQLAASLLPIAVLAVPITGNPWLGVISLGIALYMYVLILVLLQNYADLMQVILTERENGRLLRRFRYLAQHDTLTGLANRSQLLERLRDTVAARRGGDTPSVALFYLDLDGFKLINDTLGHRSGDSLLGAVGARLRQLARPDDVVARLGGDEFALLRVRAGADEARSLAAALVSGLSVPYALEGGQEAYIGVSIGLALLPDHADGADMLLQRADMALYVAKSTLGKGHFRVFDREMEERALSRARLEKDLRAALDGVPEEAGLSLHYQPIVTCDGHVSAREALARWRHPQRGPIPPGEFIPIAEENGLVQALGEWVLRTACREALSWPDGAKVAVNVSPVQLVRGGRLPAMVMATLEETGLPASRLELEVTETVLLHDDPGAMDQLRVLRHAGVTIALDDFGTGYSSLANLRDFTFDRIKIDGSFVRDAAARPHCAAIVHAVAELGRRLGAATVAEGVETEAQLALAREAGCTEVQGFLIGRPAPTGEIGKPS